MARDTKWCQNPKCPEKKNSNQIRGIKGSKYYQSNTANGYVILTPIESIALSIYTSDQLS